MVGSGRASCGGDETRIEANLTVTCLLCQAAVDRSRALLTEKRVAGVRLEEELAALREDEVDIALAIRQKQGANAALQVRGRLCTSTGRGCFGRVNV